MGSVRRYEWMPASGAPGKAVLGGNVSSSAQAGGLMSSKLKQRRMRRLKEDVAWWREEAENCRSRMLELAGEIDRLKKLVIRVPMPVLMPKEMVHQLYYTETKRCRTCNDGLRGGCSSCIFYKR